MACLVVIGAAEYPVVVGMGDQIGAIVDVMPRIMRVIFGMDAQPITTPLGSYAALYPWYALVASAHAAILGATIMAKEKRDHSADFLFTKPVPVPGSSARDCSPQCSISSRLRSSPRCSPW